MYDINAEKSVRKRKFYFHVTAIENIDTIKKNGLKANEEGHIFVFTDQKVAQEIAVYQCFLNKVALFMIDSRGITGKVIRDRVTEFVASYHRIIIQDKISKQYVRFHHSWEIDFDKPTPFEINKIKRLHRLNKADAIKYWHELRAEVINFQKQGE